MPADRSTPGTDTRRALDALGPHARSPRAAAALKTLQAELIEGTADTKPSSPFAGAKEKAAGYFAGGSAKGQGHSR